MTKSVLLNDAPKSTAPSKQLLEHDVPLSRINPDQVFKIAALATLMLATKNLQHCTSDSALLVLCQSYDLTWSVHCHLHQFQPSPNHFSLESNYKGKERQKPFFVTSPQPQQRSRVRPLITWITKN